VTAGGAPVDWRRAEQVALRVAARAPAVAPTFDASALPGMAELAERRVEAVTGLRAPTPATADGVIRLIDRGDWIRANIASFQALLQPLVDRWAERTGGPGGGRGASLRVTSQIAGAEVGVLLGWMSTRVLGQYDLLVGRDAGGDAVYLVAPNLATLEQAYGFDSADFHLWVLLHELTHRAQFTGVAWMRPHFTGLVEQAVASADPDPAALLRALREAAADRAAARERVREGGLVGLVASPEQRAVLERVGGLMSLLEGHGDVTMDRAGEGIVRGATRFGRVLRERRRRANPLAKVVQRLVGLEAKLEQYAAGARFIAEVERERGERGIERCWESPSELPSLEEIRRPQLWLDRTAREAA